MTSDAVVVTGMGAASALGTGLEEHRAALWAGRDGMRTITRFDTRMMSTHLGAMWPGWDGRTQPEPDPDRDLDLAATAAPFPLHELALVAAREAWLNAGASVVDRGRVALVFGTCFGHGFKEFSAVAERVANGLELRGPCITISTACSSSTNAIGLARDLLLRGHADVVVAGGADTLLREAFAGFSALGVLSAEPCAPFSTPTGTTLGEGAGFFVIEREADAMKRGASTYANICGYGLSADGFHETTPDPTGDGVARAIRGALFDAGWSAREIDFVSAHATGTENNDRLEWSVIARELGAVANVTGSKGHIGHTQGAAGALELVLALLAHREGAIAPTLHFRGPRDGCPSDPIAANTPRKASVSRALKLSAAFGGANAVVAYSLGAAPTRARTRSRVVIAGGAVVGHAGVFPLPDALAIQKQTSIGACAAVDLHSLGVDPRRLDRSARLLTAAAAVALSHARREGNDQTGLFVAAARMPAESSRRCTQSIQKRGIAATSASAFARMSVNAPAGACSQSLGLLGPTSTISIGEGSGLLAVVLAAEWLAWREDTKRIVAGAVDELSNSNGAVDEAEGAACVALERSNEIMDASSSVVAAAWAIAGSNDVEEVATRAMIDRASVDLVIADVDASSISSLKKWTTPDTREANSLWGAAEATRSCVMVVVAASHILAGHARSALLVAARGASSCALLLERVDR